MNIEKQLSIYCKTYKLIDLETDISFFYGKLGASIGLLHFSSKFDLEHIYDFSLKQISICFENLRVKTYLNYDIDLAILGYLFENLNHNDVLEIDTDYVLKDADVYITSSCGKTRFDSLNYRKVIFYCYYISSRYKNKQVKEANFYNFQILVLKLIEISCKLDEIHIKKDLSSVDIDLLLNTCLLSKYLMKSNICAGLSESIGSTSLEILLKYFSKLNFYEKTIVSFLNTSSSEIIDIILNSPSIIVIMGKLQITKGQLYIIFSFLKSFYVSNKELWDNAKEKVRILTELDYLSNSKIHDLSLMHGSTAYFNFTMDFGECDYAHLFSLNVSFSNKYPK